MPGKEKNPLSLVRDWQESGGKRERIVFAGELL
jgi:hypothetical protein